MKIPHFLSFKMKNFFKFMTKKESKKQVMPKHVAIIMDGNGRWAKQKKFPRFRGHIEGVKAVERVADIADKFGIKVLTLFAFSVENWQRPRQEVTMLMKLFGSAFEKKVKKLVNRNIRLRSIGTRNGVPKEVLKSIDKAFAATKDNTGLILNIAFNYGARQEILDAVKKVAEDVKKKKVDIDNIDEKMFSQYLYTAGLPDPDLLIRTSGEQRISNFLLWQLSYSELYFTDKLWPDFDEKEFELAIQEYQKRERRYGKVAVLKK